jgi:hypothetical protein
LASRDPTQWMMATLLGDEPSSAKTHSLGALVELLDAGDDSPPVGLTRW